MSLALEVCDFVQVSHHVLSISTESDIHPDLSAATKVNIVPLRPPPAILQTQNKLLFLLVAPLKVIWQTINLYHALCYQTEPAMWMIVQNPPSIPVLAVAKIACIFRGTRLIIDWHNFGWSILALKLGQGHALVSIAKVYESIMSKTADAHIAVTNAMAKVIKKTLGQDALPLHDRPTNSFQPLDDRERSAVLRRLEQTAAHVDEIESGSWRLVVSSTSWTSDEDFSILLDALVAYCEKATEDKSLPYIMAIITGKGPQKDYYMAKIHELNQNGKLPRATVSTAWLSTDDYAALLGAADLGVSLHTSSSGVDLPMKVVDMFGAGLPAIGWSKFEAWPELVKEGINGRGFGSAAELQELFVELFSGSGDKLKTIKQGALREGDRRWDDEWDAIAGRKVFHIVE
jgi:beta-1,4-mannosyltransferase